MDWFRVDWALLNMAWAWWMEGEAVPESDHGQAMAAFLAYIPVKLYGFSEGDLLHSTLPVELLHALLSSQVQAVNSSLLLALEIYDQPFEDVWGAAERARAWDILRAVEQDPGRYPEPVRWLPEMARWVGHTSHNLILDLVEGSAALQGRLDLFSDFIVLSKYRDGQATERYVVDPLELAAAITDLDLNSGLLPHDCLFWSKRHGADRLGVYLPPQIWPVVVRGEEPARRVPLPGLIFVGHQYDYSLWAVTERPADTGAPLYLAPCPNVRLQGVCRGNAPFPKAGPATIWHAVEVFFRSKFNQDLSNGKSRAYPGNVLGHWRALHAAGADRYPPDDLAPTNLTLRRLLDV